MEVRRKKLRCLENIYLIKRLMTFLGQHFYSPPFFFQKEVILELTDRYDKVTRLKFKYFIYTT